MFKSLCSQFGKFLLPGKILHFLGNPKACREIEPKTDYHGSPLLQYCSIYPELKYVSAQTHPRSGTNRRKILN